MIQKKSGLREKKTCQIDFGENFFFSFSQNKSSCKNHPVRCEVLNKCFWSYNMETHYKAEHVHFFILKSTQKDSILKKVSLLLLLLLPKLQDI